MTKKLFLVFCLIVFFSIPPVFGGEPVKLATLVWEPYIGPDMPNQGYVYELVAAAFKKGGYNTDIQYFPWARAVHLTETGRQDALFPEYYDSNREEKYVFSDPFPGGPVGFYKRKDNPISFAVDPKKDIKTVLKGLKQYSFGVVRGYINTKEFDAADYLKKDEANGDEMNLVKLFNKRIDMIFIDRYVAAHIIVRKFPHYMDQLEFMEPPLEEKKLYVAFSKQAPDYRQKLKAFNTGLKALEQDGTLEKIMMAHGF